MIGADLVELDLDGADVTQLPETDEFLDMLYRRPRTGLGLPARDGDLVDLIFPFELEQLANGFQQAGNIDRFHQIAVVERLRQWRAMRLQRARRYHQDACLMMSGLAQG